MAVPLETWRQGETIGGGGRGSGLSGSLGCFLGRPRGREAVVVISTAEEVEGMISMLLREKTSSKGEEGGDCKGWEGVGFLGFRPLFLLVSPIFTNYEIRKEGRRIN